MLINSRVDHILGIIKPIGLLNNNDDGYIPVTRGHGLISLSGHTGLCWTFVCDGLKPQEIHGVALCSSISCWSSIVLILPAWPGRRRRPTLQRGRNFHFYRNYSKYDDNYDNDDDGGDDDDDHQETQETDFGPGSG